jgi:hypothetical protein
LLGSERTAGARSRRIKRRACATTEASAALSKGKAGSARCSTSFSNSGTISAILAAAAIEPEAGGP